MCQVIIHAEGRIDPEEATVKNSNKLREKIHKIYPGLPVKVQFIFNVAHEEEDD